MLRKSDRHSSRRRGEALITALAFVVIISLLLAGIGMLVVSHDTLAHRTADYAAAINLADAGINYELARISEDTSNDTLPNQMQTGWTDSSGNALPGPYTGSITQIPGGSTAVPGTFTIWAANPPDATHSSEWGPWFAPAAALITSQGTVNGVTRTVQIQAARKSIFDIYALFSLNSTTLNGSGTTINGSTGRRLCVGSDGPITFNAGAIKGNVTFNGASPTLTTSQLPKGDAVYYNPLSQNWPTVSKIADVAFKSVRGATSGLTWISTNNNNNKIMQFKSGDTTYSLANAVPANLTQTTWNLNQDVSKTITNYNGTTYTTLNGKHVLILEPGDYYFENINFTSTGKMGILIDTASAAPNPTGGVSGQVRIWMNWTQSGTLPKDNLYSPVVFTSTDPSRFRLFYNKCSSLTIGSSSTYNGSFYAVNPTCLVGCNNSGCIPTISLQSNVTVNGSVIAENVTLNNSIINFPASGTNSNPADPGLWYGFSGAWQDIKGLKDQ